MKESTRFCVFFAMAFTIISLVSREVASYPMAESAANDGPYAALPAPLQSNNLPDANLKDLQFSQMLKDRVRLYQLLSWLQNTGYPVERLRIKKSCLINAGLSHACDYKDTLDAIHEGLYLGSDQTPGRK